MAMFGGFYKGDKKKKKKESANKMTAGVSPAFIPPKVIPKGKKEF